MNELMNIFGQVSTAQSFDQIQISIDSPERISSWSDGGIKVGRASCGERW